MDLRQQDLPGNPPEFDPSRHIIIERRHYEDLLGRLGHLENEVNLLNHGKKRRGFRAWFRRGPVVVLLALVMLGVLGAGAAEVGVYFDGNRYLSLSQPEQMGYICGVSDAYMCAAKVYKVPELYSFSKYVKGGATPVKLHAILVKYLKEHPERLKYAMADIIYDIVYESRINNPHP
jgi:hypothetical protein